MRILITGHRGFIGSYLHESLGIADTVVGLDLKDGVCGNAFYAPKVENIDVVYHLAAQSSVLRSSNNPVLDAKYNILLTIYLVGLYPKARFIYTASGGASEQGSILSPYGLSKKVAGDYVKLLHTNYVICNLPNVYGVGGNGVVEKFENDEVLTVTGNGTQTRDFVHVTDISKALCRAARWPVGEYSLGSGTPTRIIDIAERVARRTGKRIEFAAQNPEEVQDSVLPNTAPDWKPSLSLHEYFLLKDTQPEVQAVGSY